MSKIPIQAEIDIKSLLSQLKTNELEKFKMEVSALITRRKTKDRKGREVELLRQLNECVLSMEHKSAFKKLVEKRGNEKLSVKEQEQLNQLIKEEETLRLERIKILGELSQLKGISLQQLTSELGIKSPESV